MAIELNNTVNPLSGATAQYGGQGMLWQVAINGTFALGDTVTLILTDAQTGIQYQYGAGNVTGVTPTFASTFNQKVHVLAGSNDYFSALGLPMVLDDPNAAGNGFIAMSDYYSS